MPQCTWRHTSYSLKKSNCTIPQLITLCSYSQCYCVCLKNRLSNWLSHCVTVSGSHSDWQSKEEQLYKFTVATMCSYKLVCLTVFDWQTDWLTVCLTACLNMYLTVSVYPSVLLNVCVFDCLCLSDWLFLTDWLTDCLTGCLTIGLDVYQSD